MDALPLSCIPSAFNFYFLCQDLTKLMRLALNLGSFGLRLLNHWDYRCVSPPSKICIFMSILDLYMLAADQTKQLQVMSGTQASQFAVCGLDTEQ